MSIRTRSPTCSSASPPATCPRRPSRPGSRPSWPDSGGRSERVECRADVGDEVVGVLDAGAEADQAVGDVVGAPAGAALGGGVAAAEGGGFGDEVTRFEEALGGGGVLQDEGQDRAEAGPAGVVVLQRV